MRFLRYFRTSRGPSLPYKLPIQSFLLLYLLFLLFLRYLLARVFTLHEKFLLRLRFLRFLRTSRGPSLPYNLQVFAFAFAIFATFADFSRAFFAFLPFKSFLLLNLLLLLFLRYLPACVFTLHGKFLLLLRYFRTSGWSSLPYKLQVFAFAKFVFLVILAIFASVCFHVA